VSFWQHHQCSLQTSTIIIINLTLSQELIISDYTYMFLSSLIQDRHGLDVEIVFGRYFTEKIHMTPRIEQIERQMSPYI